MIDSRTLCRPPKNSCFRYQQVLVLRRRIEGVMPYGIHQLKIKQKRHENTFRDPRTLRMIVRYLGVKLKFLEFYQSTCHAV